MSRHSLRNLRFLTVFTLLPSVFLMGFGSSVASAKANLKCEHIPPIVEMMMDQHVVNNKMTSNIETRIEDQYLKFIDSGRLYLLDSDATWVKEKIRGGPKKVIETQCKVFEEVHQRMVERVKERTTYAEKYLSAKTFKLNPKITIDLDVEKRIFPKTQKESEAFQEKYVQWQVATFVSSDMKLDEAKKQVLRRYQRSLKSLNEQKPAERMTLYLNAVARSLDPHSDYLSADDREDFDIQMRLSLEGIGATLSSQDGYTVVEQLVPGGAAALSGQLQSQDKIIAVGQGEKGSLESVIDMSLKDVVRQIRGPKGTKVRLNILRKKGPGGTQTFSVTLTRQKINLEQDAAQVYYLDSKMKAMDEKVLKKGEKVKIAVIHLPSFYSDPTRGGRSCYEDVKKLLKDVKEKNPEGLVLDLSTNTGGSLDDAVKLTGLFIGSGNIVRTKGRDDTGKVKSKTTLLSRLQGISEDGNEPPLADEDTSVQYHGPLIVLTSRLSASASEILAGALKDYKRAIVVGGDHTFGKGSVQQVRPLPEGLGAYKVTVGMFFTPGGNSTQHIGVTGDIVLPGIFSTDDIGEKSLDYNLPPATIAPFLSDTAYVKEGPEAWKMVDSGLIAELGKASKARVAGNDEFKKIVKDIDEMKAKNKVVTLSEILNKKEETVKKDKKRKTLAQDPSLRKEEYLKRPELLEGVQIMIDWLAKTQKGA